MRERFNWGDTDGNNGYKYDQFTPAELQAAWELRGMPYWDAFAAISHMAGLKLWLDYYGQPTTPYIPVKKDAMAIKAAICARAEEIKASGKINPPSIEQIRQSILALRK